MDILNIGNARNAIGVGSDTNKAKPRFVGGAWLRELFRNHLRICRFASE
jgi:hypothetical protein